MVQGAGQRIWTRSLRWCAAAAAVTTACLALSAAPSSAAPLTWAPATNITSYRIAGMSCASPTLCVGVAGGDLVSSPLPNGGAGAWTLSPLKGLDNAAGISCVLGSGTEKLCAAPDCAAQAWSSGDPLGGGGTWSAVGIEGLAGCGLGEIPTAVACPSTAACIAAGSRGSVIYSGSPRGPSEWKTGPIDGGIYLNAISCPSVSLCVIADNEGKVLTSTSPLGGSWTPAYIDGKTPIMSVSCSPAPTVCVAGDGAGHVLTTTNPVAGAGAWTSSHVDGENSLLGVSCPSLALCVAVDNAGGAVVSTAPAAGAAAWTREQIATYVIGTVSCPSASLCVAADWKGNVIVATGGSTEPPPPSTSGEKSKGTPGTPETHVFVPPALLAGVETGPEGQTTVALTCPGGGADCGMITAQLTVRFTVKGHTVTGVLAARRPRTVVRTTIVASGSLRLAAGASGKIRLKLNASGRAALTRFKKLTAQLRIVGPSGLQATRTVKLAKARRKAPKKR